MSQNIDFYWIQIIQTLIVIVIWIIIRLVLIRIIKRRFIIQQFTSMRKKIALKSSFTILNLVVVAILVIIWSIDQSDILLFFSSIVTILGVAFFAQWSHLSNITSGIIIFFNTDTKIGDHIQILDKDFDLEGQIYDIGSIFTKVKINDNEMISLPNNILLQKAIKIKSNV